MPDLTPNLRDIGGRPTTDGRTVATGRVLRSAVPHADDHGPDGHDWPPALVIDLRSPSESRAGHPLEAAGSRVVNVPLLAALRPGVAPAESLSMLYRIVLDDAAHELVRLVDEVSRETGTVLIHCAAGKDRTGIAVALLLRLVGVPRDEVLHDYRLTEHALVEIDRRLRPPTSAPASAAPGHTYPPGFAHVSPEAIDAVLDVWDEHPAGVEGWFVEVGGSSASLDQLRRTLLA
ncbi:tyrosine-protein phosphatase [Aeromicrobium sp. CFBP 8757]|uniref:tyrosine-protein phosphatase n=1 Tax=Aeromicrobium sp. CFBP 8757 TaxID=2775288 RepID=UPI00177F4E19|nr:tyrosine-protein phosphatase [Aeromicrobium sp. CFBP 8757]